MERTNDGFLKMDFHVHTAGSLCYDEADATADDIVEATLRAGLSAIVVTDHNTADGVDNVRSVGRTRGLIVFPGIELTTIGGHILAVFDPEESVDRLRDLIAVLAIPPELRGDGNEGSPVDIESAFAAIANHGGIAIAAHIERWRNGFIDAAESLEAQWRIYNNPHLSALEITQPKMKQQWNEGKVWGFPRGRACVQGSDAHAPSQIGRRPVYLRSHGGRLDLVTLKRAFDAYWTEIKFPHELGNTNFGCQLGS